MITHDIEKQRVSGQKVIFCIYFILLNAWFLPTGQRYVGQVNYMNSKLPVKCGFVCVV